MRYSAGASNCLRNTCKPLLSVQPKVYHQSHIARALVAATRQKTCATRLVIASLDDVSELALKHS
jgi:hypothetical protein